MFTSKQVVKKAENKRKPFSNFNGKIKLQLYNVFLTLGKYPQFFWGEFVNVLDLSFF